MGVHPHVQRGIDRIGKSALGLIELHRGNTQIEQHSVDRRRCVVTQPIKRVGQTVVAGMHTDKSCPERRQPRPGDIEGIGVAIEADDRQTGQHGEKVFGMPAGAQSGIDQNRARAVGGTAGQCRCE
ncbi:Uncharacterised protein [Mycobacteroides abscessus subsp. massiliense]|nr:Uncharacterised protein [Mycobacteroides abscessus subsp. massiliense]